MRYKISLLTIFVLAFTLRFWQLGIQPASLDWDEVSLGYNAYSILKTGKDEYGNFLPLAIRSFNDYKPPLYTYLTILPVAIFGLSEFSTRFIAAFSGFLTIIIGYLLVIELFPRKSSKYILLFTLFFAVSPWHIQFSRIAFESNVALFFFLSGLLFFLKGLHKGYLLMISACAFTLSLYTYHSPRLAVPIILFILILGYRRILVQKIKWSILAGIFITLSFIPLVMQLGSATGMRLGSVTILNPDQRLGTSIEDTQYDISRGDEIGKILHNRRIVYAREVLAGYLDHFNFDFLFLFGDAAGRHHPVDFGMLYLWDFLFILLGIFVLIKEKGKGTFLIFAWFIAAPVASSLTTGTPHAVRSLLYLPIYQIFTTFGLFTFIGWVKNHIEIKKARVIVSFILFLFLINFFYYLHMYYIHTSVEHASEWQWGYKQMIEEVQKIESRYDRIIVTYQYDQPYIYFLFYNKTDPRWYQSQWPGGEIMRSQRQFGRYEFRIVNWSSDQHLKNTLLVGTPKEIPPDASGITKEIHFPDGTVAFRIVSR